MLQGEHPEILSTFIKLPFVIKIFVLSIFELQFYTGFTVFIIIFDKLIYQLETVCIYLSKHCVSNRCDVTLGTYQKADHYICMAENYCLCVLDTETAKKKPI